MQRHYAGITTRMLSEIESISSQMSHSGEKGRNNELVLAEFLKLHLPQRYSVSTGKIVAVGGAESGQIDVIIHDRMNTPALVDARAWSLVPIEAVHAVISVKTTLTKTELRAALGSIQSVRNLPRKAAVIISGNVSQRIPEEAVLRPRGYVFAFKSDWKEAEGVEKAFVEVTTDINDELRPNGVCVLDQAFVIRKAFTLDTILFTEHVLMHFFVYLVRAMDSRHRYMVDLSQYFTEDYGLGKAGTNG